MTVAAGLVGFGLLALACVVFFVLLAGVLVYVAVCGNPETKHWRAFAANHKWECDGPWRLSGGPPGARWTLSADYDDDRGTGTITWTQLGVPISVPRLLVLRRADYERDRAQSRLASGASRLSAVMLDIATAAVAVASNAGRPALDGLRDAAVGGPRFRQYWVVLGEDERDGQPFLDAATEAVWLTALDAMPSMFANHDVMFEVRVTRLCLRAEGARRRPSFDEVEAFVRLGLALAARVRHS